MVRSAYLSWSRILISVFLFVGAAYARSALLALASPAGGASWQDRPRHSLRLHGTVAMKKLLLIFMILFAVAAVADQNSPIPWGQYVPFNPGGFSGSGNVTGYELTGTYMYFPVPMKLDDISMYVYAAAGNVQILIRNADGSTGPLGLPEPGSIPSGCAHTSSQAVGGTGVQVFSSGCGTTVLPAGGYYIDFMTDNSSFQVMVVANGFGGIARYLTTGASYGTWNSTFVVSLTETSYGTYAIWTDAIPQSVSSPGTADCIGGWPQPMANNGLAQAGNVAYTIGWQKAVPQCTGKVKAICNYMGSYGGSSGNWNGGVWDATGAATVNDGDLGPNNILVQGTPVPYYSIGFQCVTPTTSYTVNSGTTYWVGAVPDTSNTGSALCIPPGCTSSYLGGDYYMYQSGLSSLTLANVSGTPSNNGADWLFNFMIVEPLPATGRRLRGSVVNSQ
jgi:hypothetical protein